MYNNKVEAALYPDAVNGARLLLTADKFVCLRSYVHREV